MIIPACVSWFFMCDMSKIMNCRQKKPAWWPCCQYHMWFWILSCISYNERMWFDFVSLHSFFFFSIRDGKNSMLEKINDEMSTFNHEYTCTTILYNLWYQNCLKPQSSFEVQIQQHKMMLNLCRKTSFREDVHIWSEDSSIIHDPIKMIVQIILIALCKLISGPMYMPFYIDSTTQILHAFKCQIIF